jgi:outer membrane protein TolC
MRHFLLLLNWLLFLFLPLAHSQTFPTPDYFHSLTHRPQIPSQLPEPEGLRDYLVSGKLRLALTDAIRLTLLNNTEVHLNQLQYEGTRFAIQRAYQPFDPFFTSGFNATRQTIPTYSQLLSGAPTLSDLNQQTRFGYAQTFQTGTQVNTSFNANRSSTNSIFFTFNPSFFTNLNFSFMQPLLRNRGFFPNRAPIIIARRNLNQSRADFEGQVNTSIARAVDQYWDTVQARENLNVLRKSLELAEATYRQNKRALELGALPPLDIYRSESQVATRRVSVIQAEYLLKQTEDELRRTIGADLDPYVQALDLELVESSKPSGELFSIDAQEALQRALEHRPELEGLRQQLANDDTSIRLAHHRLQPDLSLNSFYTSNGLGGNQIDTAMLPPRVIARGGLGDALSELGSFAFPTYGFNLQLNLPVKNRAVEADLGNALVAKRRSLYLLRQVEQGITLEVRNAVHQLEQAKLSMAAAQIARDLAQKNLEAEQRKYELGAQPIFFTLEAQSQLSLNELNLVQAEIGYQRSLAAVDRATATLLERHRVQISDPVQ